MGKKIKRNNLFKKYWIYLFLIVISFLFILIFYNIFVTSNMLKDIISEWQEDGTKECNEVFSNSSPLFHLNQNSFDNIKIKNWDELKFAEGKEILNVYKTSNSENRNVEYLTRVNLLCCKNNECRLYSIYEYMVNKKNITLIFETERENIEIR